MKNQKISHLLFSIVIILILFGACVGDKNNTSGPQVVTIQKEKQGPGDVWIEPLRQTVAAGSGFTTEIHLNAGKQKVAAFGIVVKYDSKILSVNESIGKSGAEEGPDGYLTAVNAGVAGEMKISGFDVYGKGPGENLHIVTVNWNAKKKGTANLVLYVENLVDEKLQNIGTLAGYASEIVVE